MRVLVVGEGCTDTGFGSLAGEEKWPDLATGVIPILVRRILAARLGKDPPGCIFDGDRLPRFHRVRGYPAKVCEAILEAHRRGYSAAVIVVDRDTTPGHERLQKLREGRDLAASRVPTPAAVGVAIEAMEAWLLADEVVLGSALEIKPNPPRGPDPETLSGARGSPDHPKARLAIFLDQDTNEHRPVIEKLEAIASELDPSEIEKRCKRGFKPFADEVRTRLLPLWE